MIKSTKLVLQTAISLLLAFTIIIPQVFASHAWVNSSGEPYHWARTTDTFTLKLLDSMSGEWSLALAGAVSDWNLSEMLDLAVEAGSGKRTCRGKDGMVEACNAVYGSTGWLGIASIWAYSDGHITKGTVQMNDTYFSMEKYNTDAWRNLVVCQEIGHTLGLDHQDETFNNANLDTCMDYTSSPDSNQHPNGHDYEELVSMYSHLDGFDSYAKNVEVGGGKGNGKGKPQNVGQDIDPENPSSWGMVVKEDARGNPTLYVRHLGNGQTVFTHVTWAEEYRSGGR